MSTYLWLDEQPSAFELRIMSNTRAFVGPYGPATQVLDLLGERWTGRIDLSPETDTRKIMAREAFFDRLKGAANTFSIWHFGAPVAAGTIGGTPTLLAEVAQNANTATLVTAAGATAYAGSMLGLPGQTVRLMADATADGSGHMAIEFQPRARATMALGGSVTLIRPTITVRVKAGDVPIPRQPGYAEGCSFEFVEHV